MDVRVVDIRMIDIVRMKVAENTVIVRDRWERLRLSDIKSWRTAFGLAYTDARGRMVVRVGYDFGKITREWAVLYEPVVRSGVTEYVYRLVSLAYMKSFESVVLGNDAKNRMRVIGVYEESGVETLYDHLEQLVGESPDYIVTS